MAKTFLVQVTLEAMRQGLAVTIAPRHPADLTQEAADMLGISAVRMLEAGRFPSEESIGTASALCLAMLEFRRRSDVQTSWVTWWRIRRLWEKVATFARLRGARLCAQRLTTCSAVAAPACWY